MKRFQKDFIEDMKECVRLAKEAGIADEKIILDPGVGFGKTYEMNLEIIAHLEILQELGYPVLLGTSRKSVIGLTLDLPVDQREEGTMVTTVYGVQKGSAFVRVHDVAKKSACDQNDESSDEDVTMKADKMKKYEKPGGVCQSWYISGRKCTGTEICRQCGVVYRYKKGGTDR